MKKTSILILIFSIILSSCVVKDNPRLKELAKTDQADRRENNPQTSKNDVERLNEVKKIIETKELTTSNDYFNAAIIFQHGDNPEDYKMANEFAKKAVKLNPQNLQAKILIAQSEDRYLISINKPQIYGTQRIILGELEYLQNIDTTVISDTKRREIGVMTLPEKLQYFNKKHQKNEKNILAYVPSDSLLRTFFPEKRADLIGGFDELLSQINYPEEALKNNISGKVLVEYTITPEGNTRNILVLDGIGYGCDEEAKRIISLAKFKNYLNQDIERRTRIPFEVNKIKK